MKILGGKKDLVFVITLPLVLCVAIFIIASYIYSYILISTAITMIIYSFRVQEVCVNIHITHDLPMLGTNISGHAAQKLASLGLKTNL